MFLARKKEEKKTTQKTFRKNLPFTQQNNRSDVYDLYLNLVGRNTYQL